MLHLKQSIRPSSAEDQFYQAMPYAEGRKERAMYIDIQTIIIVVMSTFMVGFMMGVRFNRPRCDRYDR